MVLGIAPEFAGVSTRSFHHSTSTASSDYELQGPRSCEQWQTSRCVSTAMPSGGYTTHASSGQGELETPTHDPILAKCTRYEQAVPATLRNCSYAAASATSSRTSEQASGSSQSPSPNSPPPAPPERGGRGGVGLGWRLLGSAQIDKPRMEIPGITMAADTQTQSWSLSRRGATIA